MGSWGCWGGWEAGEAGEAREAGVAQEAGEAHWKGASTWLVGEQVWLSRVGPESEAGQKLGKLSVIDQVLAEGHRGHCLGSRTVIRDSSLTSCRSDLQLLGRSLWVRD